MKTREDAGVFTLFLMAQAITHALSVTPADLAISLVFGAGQVIVGSALAWRGLGHSRWRRVAPFLMALIGLWVVCSGVAELLVSGLVAAAQGWHVPTARTLAAVRHAADTGLFVAAVLLAVAFVCYLVVWRAGWLASRQRDGS